MLFIAVVDDDPRCCENIAAAVHAHMLTRGGECRVAAFADAAGFLAEAKAQRFDIAVLDIIMPQKSGLDAALELHERNHGCRIIFLTVSQDYAIHGYRVSAVDYLLKPVDSAALGRALDKCLERGPRAPAPALILCEKGKTEKVAASDILYCRSEGNYVFFFAADRMFRDRSKLGECKARLPGCFIQTHKRYLVNLARVAAMRAQVLRLDSGDEIPISRAFKESVTAAYFAHVSGEAAKA